MEIEIGDKVYCEKKIGDQVFEGGYSVDFDGTVHSINGEFLTIDCLTGRFGVHKKHVIKVEKGYK